MPSPTLTMFQSGADGSALVPVSPTNPLPITGGTGSSSAVAQGSTTAGQTAPLVQGAVTTAAPAYTTGQTSPVSLSVAGALRVQVTSVSGTNLAQTFSAGGGSGWAIGSFYNTTPPTGVNGGLTSLQSDVRGNMKVATGGNSSSLNITAAANVKATPGKVYRVVLNTAGSTATSIIDSAGTTATAANTILTIPATAVAGTVFVLEWPFAVGLSVVPGTNAVLAASFD